MVAPSASSAIAALLLDRNPIVLYTVPKLRFANQGAGGHESGLACRTGLGAWSGLGCQGWSLVGFWGWAGLGWAQGLGAAAASSSPLRAPSRKHSPSCRSNTRTRWTGSPATRISTHSESSEGADGVDGAKRSGVLA